MADPERTWTAAELTELAEAFEFDDPGPLKADILSALRCAARLSGEERAWQPIETAPKDGTRMDLWAKSWLPAFDRFESKRFADCYWRQQDVIMGGWKAAWIGVSSDWLPTHWMPLPDAPAAPSREGA